MARKKESPAMQEIRSLLPYFGVVNAVYFAVVLVLFFAFGFDYTLIVGAVYGNIIAAANFWLMGLTAEKAVKMGSARSAQTYMNAMYCVRYLGVFALLTAAALLPFINLITALVPLFFARICITLRALREK